MIFKKRHFPIGTSGGNSLRAAAAAVVLLQFVTIALSVVTNPYGDHSAVTGPLDNDLLQDETPEGYYAFVEAPKLEPPQVKLPPYLRTNGPCAGLERRTNAGSGNLYRRSTNNLCGDLNKGTIPSNPMAQNIYGTPYPFELIKNKTLEFFSKTLPILKSDETIPKVATLQTEPQYYLYQQTPPRRICLLYKLFQGQAFKSLVAQKRQDYQPPEYRTNGESVQHGSGGGGGGGLSGNYGSASSSDGPPTPCPAKVEYATPVFAKNYQGIWRYVVQIPYEGYFTQTIEVTKCTNTKCHYMDGGCLSSPRWVSLLVAEIFYPETIMPVNRRPPVHRSPVRKEDPPPVQDFQNYQQYLHKRAAPMDANRHISSPSSSQAKRSHCDGVDDLGCFQVRLYYDWFLVPGSCKCWRPDYFAKYMRYGREEF